MQNCHPVREESFIIPPNTFSFFFQSYQTYASPVYHTSYQYHNLHKRSPTFGNVEIDLPTAALIKAAAVAGAGKGLLLASTIPAGTFTLAGGALALGR